MGLFKDLGSKAAELMEEDTVYSSSKRNDGSSYEMLLKASDKNYLAYISAFVRLLNKKKNPGGDFYTAINETIDCRPKDIQRKARDILNSRKK